MRVFLLSTYEVAGSGPIDFIAIAFLVWNIDKNLALDELTLILKLMIEDIALTA